MENEWKRKKECENTCKICYNNICRIINEEKYDVVILDELMSMIQLEFISVQQDVKLINNKPKRNLWLSDYVNEIKAFKHPFEQGVNARKGIEF